MDFFPDILRKHVNSQIQSAERLRLPGPGLSQLCQIYIQPESEVDYEPDIPSKIGYIHPLSAGGLRDQNIGFGLRRAPTQCKVWEEFRLSIVYFPVGVPFLSFGFYPKGVFPWRF